MKFCFSPLHDRAQERLFDEGLPHRFPDLARALRYVGGQTCPPTRLLF